MASYIWGACVATPNSPPPQVKWGVQNWLSIVDSRQLVLALPWYGRKYPCAAGTAKDGRFCPIEPAPWRDATCTDAAADAVDFGDVAVLANQGTHNANANLDAELNAALE